MDKLTIYLILLIILSPSNHYSQHYSVLKGNLVDSLTNQPVYNASILADEIQRGTTSNERGNFILKVPENIEVITLKIYHIYYETKTVKIYLHKLNKKNFVIKLRQGVIPLGAVVVKGEKTNESAGYLISGKTINNLPALAEPDIIRAVSFLPGVSQFSDYNPSLHIRGGFIDQNAIVYDGIELFNPYYLLGVFSSINTKTIDKTNIWTANYPPEHAGRLSGIISLSSIDRESKPFVNLNLSLISANFTIAKKYGNTFLLFGVKRSYLDLIMALLGKRNFDFKLYNINFKVSHQFSGDIETDIIAFENNEISNDPNLENENSPNNKIYRGNKAIGIKQRFKNHSILFSFCRNFNEYSNKNYYYKNIIDDFGVKYKYEFDINYLKQRIGFNFRNINVLNNWDLDNDFKDSFFGKNIPFTYAKRAGVNIYQPWLENEILALNKLKIKIKNLTMITNLSNSIYLFPGFTLEYYPSSVYKFSINAEKNYQLLTTGIFEEENYNLINKPYFIIAKPLQAYILGVGNDFNFGNNYYLSVNAYYKIITKTLKLLENNKYPEFSTGSGKSYGVEIMFEKLTGILTYQLNYTYQKTFYSFKNETYQPKWSFPHFIKGIMGIELGKTWKFNLSFSFHSGALYNRILGYYKSIGLFAGEDSDKYDVVRLSDHIIFDDKKTRYKPYWRLDVSFRKKYKGKYFDWILYIQVQNITFNDNPVEIYSDKFALDIIKYGKPQDSGYLSGLPIIPSVGAEFIF